MVDLRLQKLLPLGSVVHRPAWSPHGDALAAPTRDGSVHILDLAAEAIVSVLKRSRSRSVSANAVCWLEDRESLAVGYEDGTISLWNIPQRAELDRLSLHRERIEDLGWSISRRLLAAASGDGRVSIWSPPKSTPIKVLPHGYWVNSAVWSPDGDVLATGAEDNKVRLWTGVDLSEVKIVMTHKSWVTDIAWHPTRLLLASTSFTSVQIWNGTEVHQIEETSRDERVRTVSFSADGNLIAAKRDGGQVQLFETYNWTLVTSLVESTAFQGEYELMPESRAVFHPLKPMVCTLGDGNNALRIWNVDYNYEDTWLIAPTKKALIETSAKVVELCREAMDVEPIKGRPGIGHNRPPTNELREEALYLSTMLQGEHIEQREVAASKIRFQKFIDILSEKTAESIGKSLGPALVAGLVAAVLSLVKLLETLIKILP